MTGPLDDSDIIVVGFDIVIENSHYISRDFDNVVEDVSYQTGFGGIIQDFSNILSFVNR